MCVSVRVRACVNIHVRYIYGLLCLGGREREKQNKCKNSINLHLVTETLLIIQPTLSWEQKSFLHIF